MGKFLIIRYLVPGYNTPGGVSKCQSCGAIHNHWILVDAM